MHLSIYLSIFVLGIIQKLVIIRIYLNCNEKLFIHLDKLNCVYEQFLHLNCNGLDEQYFIEYKRVLNYLMIYFSKNCLYFCLFDWLGFMTYELSLVI